MLVRRSSGGQENYGLGSGQDYPRSLLQAVWVTVPNRNGRVLQLNESRQSLLQVLFDRMNRIDRLTFGHAVQWFQGSFSLLHQLTPGREDALKGDIEIEGQIRHQVVMWLVASRGR
jgi:hypothetical protein